MILIRRWDSNPGS